MKDDRLLIAFGGDWKSLAGPVQGLSQRALVGTLAAWAGTAIDRGKLDVDMAQLLEEPAPETSDDSDPDTFLVQRTAYWAGVAQRRFGIPVSERFAIEPLTRHETHRKFRVFLPHVDRKAALIALEWARARILDCLAGDPIASGGTASLAQELSPYSSSINVFRFLRAADRMRMPVSSLTPTLIQYGIGPTSRLMVGSYIDTTSAIGAQIADSKAVTALVLRRAGLPGPMHYTVANADEAATAAMRLGYPVVVKPNDCDRGQGVFAGLANETAMRAAFGEATGFSSDILIEKHFDGLDYRLTVFEGRVLQIIHRRPGGVFGDGLHTLAELVAMENARPENRRRQRDFGGRLLDLDAEAIDLAGEQGLTIDSVIPQERFVPLRRRANVSTGGTPISVPPGDVHPDNLALAVRAAKALRLNLAGVDLILPDIARSWLQTGALVCEVNGQPQISITGSPEIHADILRSTTSGRPSIPIIAHVSSGALKGLGGLALPDAILGVSSAGGIWVNREQIAGPQPGGFIAAQALFSHSEVDVAVVHLTPDDILTSGLPFADCDCAVVDDSVPASDVSLTWLKPHLKEGILRSKDPLASIVQQLAALPQSPVDTPL